MEINKDNIMFFKYNNVDRRWIWWNVSFVKFSINVVLRLKCVGVIRELWVYIVIIWVEIKGFFLD